MNLPLTSFDYKPFLMITNVLLKAAKAPLPEAPAGRHGILS